jgi:hypothetical protein
MITPSLLGRLCIHTKYYIVLFAWKWKKITKNKIQYGQEIPFLITLLRHSVTVNL